MRRGLRAGRIAVLLFVCLAAAAEAATFTVTSPGDDSDANPGDGLCDDGVGACTLRAAIEEANALAGADRVAFALSGTTTISSFGLLTISEALVVDGGGSQPGFEANDLAAGTNAVVPVLLDALNSRGDGFRITAPNVEIRNLGVRGFANCIHVAASVSDVVVAGSRIELCGAAGVWMEFLATRVRVGGLAPAERNLISGNGTGVFDDGTGNFIVGNLIGTDELGMAVRANDVGVRTRNGAAVTGNLISGNRYGVWVLGPDVVINRNYIGTTADGTAALRNTVGIQVEPGSLSPTNARIGRPGSSMAEANLVSGNDVGIGLVGRGNFVQANFIGTGPRGVGSVPNGIGINVLLDANVIGAPPGVTPTNEGN
jgi:CSLREA domain-containing protein